MDGAAVRLAAVVERAESSLRAAVESAGAASAGTGTGTVAEWAAALSGLARLVATAQAAEDLSITRLAAIETEVAEDGTLAERHRSPGHVSLDAAAVVAGAMCTTTAHAENRVHDAVRRVADGPTGTDAATGLAGLHEAMRDGRLDVYRAGVLADELLEVPPEVAASVVAALAPYFDREDGPRLRRRCRRMLARVCPDLLSQRIRRARSESRLERWASEPGVDTWHGTFPSEEAARAWAAVDALAQQYVADGTCQSVDRARAKALTDLVTGNATVTTELVLTVPQELVEDAGPEVPVHPAAVAAERSSSDAARSGRSTLRTATGRATAIEDRLQKSGPEPARDGAAPTLATDRPASEECELVEVPGLRPSEPMVVPRSWLQGLARAAGDAAGQPARSRARRRALRVRACDPITGALVEDVAHSAVETADPGPCRPPPALAELVRARDGRCRFPGCHVSARFCDLDHVRPWPLGPTTAANLVCLCRRHHRTKQRPGWVVRLDSLGTLWWDDPSGRVRSSEPLDALHPMVLPRPAARVLSTLPRTTSEFRDGPHSLLEFTLEHLLVGVGRSAPHGPATAHPARGDLPDTPPF